MAGTHQRVGVVRDAGKLCVHRQLSCKDKNDASKGCTEGVTGTQVSNETPLRAS
jgi:hypothetical protein